MGGCSAINCTNSTTKGYRMFRFPADPVRRRKWAVRCRGDAWVPGPCARLCNEHFEESQYEMCRADGLKKLKSTAVPTLFDVSHAPETVGPKRKEGYNYPKPDSLLASCMKNKQMLEDGHTLFDYDVGLNDIVQILARQVASDADTDNSEISKDTPNKENKNHTSKHSQSGKIQKKKQGSSKSNQNSQKENVSLAACRSKNPCTAVTLVSDSSTDKGADNDEKEGEESDDEKAQQQIALLKRENESIKQKMLELEKHNKSMARVIFELEKHNKLMSVQLIELDKDNKVLTKKVSDLERRNEYLEAQLNCSVSEEQLARMYCFISLDVN